MYAGTRILSSREQGISASVLATLHEAPTSAHSAPPRRRGPPGAGGARGGRGGGGGRGGARGGANNAAATAAKAAPKLSIL